MNIRRFVIVFMVLMLSLAYVTARKNRRLENDISNTNNRQIPRDSGAAKTVRETVMAKLSNVKSKKDFYKLFNIPMEISKDNVGRPGIPGGIDGAPGKRKSTLAKKCYCSPGPAEHVMESTYSIGYYPSCFTVRKCGGCCNRFNFLCKPTSYETEIVNPFQIQLRKGTAKQVSFALQHHKTCSCQCRLTQADCNPRQLNKEFCACTNCIAPKTCSSKQKWSDIHCDCVCNNTPKRCDDPNKVWSNDTCSCSCKKYNCPIGQQQNQNNCLCV